MPVSAPDVAELTKGSLKKRFYVVLNFPLASEEQMMEHIRDHLDYMRRHEDKVFLSDPFRPGQDVPHESVSKDFLDSAWTAIIFFPCLVGASSLGSPVAPTMATCGKPGDGGTFYRRKHSSH